MCNYDSDKIKEIRKSVNLVDYISQTIDLQRKGKDHFGKCPLHDDSDPSFSVNEERNLFYCFSCHRGGSIIEFLMHYEGLSYSKALEKAAGLANVDFESMEIPETLAYLKSKKGNNAKTENIKRQPIDLSEMDKYEKAPAQEWLDEGISAETQALFDVRIDKISNRIVYPVFDDDGNFINIKGRTRLNVYKELKIPKYINYFGVGTIDYFQGLHLTRNDVLAKKEIILFESIKSVMKCYDWGFHNCASIESHQLTDKQVKILINLECDVVLAFDSDVDINSKECKKLRRQLNKLKRFVNVYIIEDPDELMGGKSAKNAPADLGKEVWETLYESKKAWL